MLDVVEEGSKYGYFDALYDNNELRAKQQYSQSSRLAIRPISIRFPAAKSSEVCSIVRSGCIA